MLRNIRLIIFDLDGTLIDAYPAIIKSFNYVMQRLQQPKQAPQVIRRSVGWGDENLLKPFLAPKDLKKGVSLYRSHHRSALLTGSRLFPDTKRLLTYLKKKGYRLAVASNRPTQFSFILIRHLGLAKYFDYILCADKLKNIKPHPQILHKIMRRFSQGPKQVLYIGDMTIDAQAGLAAGVKTIIVTTGSSPRAQIAREKPYRIIRGIKELFGLL